ncbi:c-type cytochrome [Brucella pituitosa]|uniref:c-type cytochrome n=1 Tax=Brucella pituitosa TaxID=571256 RepID=UPI003F4AC200
MTIENKGGANAFHQPDENFEPYEQHGKMPWPLIAIAVGLGLWGAATLFDTREDIATAQADRTAASRADTGLTTDPGSALFTARCSTCHQPDGMGVRGAIPPLAGSPFVAQGPELVAAILMRGIDGPIRVNDHIFNGHMPSFASALTDIEIGALSTHVAHRFGGSSEAYPTTAVAALRAAIADRGSFKGGQDISTITGLDFGNQPVGKAQVAHSLTPDVSKLIFTGRGEQWACASCHGDLGQGKENTPRLAGLSADYIVKQLDDFANGRRLNESMRLVVETLSDSEKRQVADYYAGLRVPSTAKPELDGDLARGEALALHGDWSRNVPACFSCHGPSGFGVSPEFPPLAAQQAAYTASQLAAWAGGHRNNSSLDLMGRISRQLDDADRTAVADYLASLPPVPAGEAEQIAKTGVRP